MKQREEMVEEMKYQGKDNESEGKKKVKKPDKLKTKNKLNHL